MSINEEHPVMITPKENLSLWRYMDIPSFLSLLTSNSLTFVRADLFEDKYEGKLPRPTAALIDHQMNLQINNGEVKPMCRKFSEILDRDNKNIFLNCWCKANHEMVHMWKIYSKENGIAIETTYERLKNSIVSTEAVYPTEIQYLDYKRDIVDWKSNGLTAFTIKRKEYQSENEFRLLIAYPRILEDQLKNFKTHEQINPVREKLYSETPVIHCKVNISDLITRIYISPYAPKWYFEVIKNVSFKCGLKNIEIIQSDL